jgi:hypothetical protein
MFDLLREAIAAQYAAFRAPRPRHVEGCVCCTAPEQLAALISGPREALGAPELDFYARKAMTTVGTTADFRYYWPRLAELTLQGALLTDTEIVFGKPLCGTHHGWPAQEQEALKQLAAAIGQWLATEEQEPSDVDMWVCAAGLLSEHLADPRDLLVPLLGESAAAWANLRALADWNREEVRKKRRLVNAFWENAPENAARLLEWLTTEPRVREAARANALESAALYGTVPPAD